jgi:hypothetical protein
MQISRMVLVCDVKIGQLGRKNLAVRFNLISDPPRLAANADGVEPNNPFDEIYEAPERMIMLVVARSAFPHKSAVKVDIADSQPRASCGQNRASDDAIKSEL